MMLSPERGDVEPDTAPAVVLTIAGFDPSSGAGLTADLKVFAAHGFYGVAAATALTVQSTRGVRRVEPVDPSLLAETLACLAEDLPLAGVKIGMLATAGNVDAVCRFLEGFTDRGVLPIVLDPVLRSSSGYALLDPEGVERMRARLLPLVSCITPNTDELLLLSDSGGGEATAAMETVTESLVEEAAALLARRVPGLSIVATGGHLAEPDDCVLVPGMAPVWLRGKRLETTATHGTGCGYSSALLCGLVAGLSTFAAAGAAKNYVTEALRRSTPMGSGGGSMHHLYPVVSSYQGAERPGRR